jgi:hypothetical protein
MRLIGPFHNPSFLGSIAQFVGASKKAGTFTELKEVIDRIPGKTGLMLFMFSLDRHTESAESCLSKSASSAESMGRFWFGKSP